MCNPLWKSHPKKIGTNGTCVNLISSHPHIFWMKISSQRAHSPFPKEGHLIEAARPGTSQSPSGLGYAGWILQGQAERDRSSGDVTLFG
jgi:hypothetical protein